MFDADLVNLGREEQTLRLIEAREAHLSSQQHAAVQDREKALEFARRSRELAPDSLYYCRYLGTLLVQSGDLVGPAQR